MKKKTTERKKCSLFEEMLMWTSYRYCIGRHTYVTSLAGEMAQHYYDRLSDERMEFTASDIRREIMDHLQWLPFNFRIQRWYDSDAYNPIDVLMNFIEKYDIKSYEEFITYNKVEYDVNHDVFTFEKKEPTFESYFNLSDIDDLIPWETLAACFDKKNHKIITTEYDGKVNTYECFKTWVRKSVPCEDKPGYYRQAEFGWEPRWIVVDEYLKTGNIYKTLNEKFITKVEDIKEKRSN